MGDLKVLLPDGAIISTCLPPMEIYRFQCSNRGDVSISPWSAGELEGRAESDTHESRRLRLHDIGDWYCLTRVVVAVTGRQHQS
ncbi:hypothetical protein EXIGLDRAFT_719784 [Exidia glandulosa HHB12029]|uniref:Uncharacterized protein n=1 Tax=Exidia glandulosa HHB12029 TaxID=1314781 RepID=A0A165GSM6_EXIGL|nr:hypothetical protein EXIGLDRAFT_719784 [Exidia glandulosa HHB12029]